MTDNQNSSKRGEFVALYRPQPHFKAEAFDSSAIDYKDLVTRVTIILSALEEGAVLAIDAPWGSGKSFFGRNFDAHLTKLGWKTCYIDAFRGEYVEDPFLLIASAIREKVDDPGKQRTFTKAAVKVGKSLLPIVGKALVRAGTANVVSLDDAKEFGKVLSDAIAEATETLIADQLASYEKDRRSFEAFVKQLADFAANVKETTKHPLVVFIDELDRCPPPFAVRMLERIKHLFDVPHLTFVLLLDRKQLERAVNGVYGAGIDADAYLRKFVHFTFQLPKRSKAEPGRTTDAQEYVSYLAKSISLGSKQAAVIGFARALARYVDGFGLSLRDVERAYLQFVLTHHAASEISEKLTDILAFLITLRVRSPETYQELLNRKEAVLQPIKEVLTVCVGSGMPKGLADLLTEACIAHINNEGQQGETRLSRLLFDFGFGPEQTVWVLARLIDPLPER
ncbi:MAG TPA: P-loop NTPase fold protein [Pyrinomonadaceae bacterium]|nr:P-loop NTPase fold protein [Pyrinomonadaceae bacterium]